MEYTPPLVSGNRLELYNNIRDTLDEKGLDIGGYIRISTKKDSQKSSIENQKKYISEWAEVNGYNLVRFYIDVKSGAYTYLRNEMNNLRNDVAAGRIKGIVSKEISRTSRDIMDILELKRSLADKGAFFIAIKEGYDSRTDDDEFLLIIHAGLAQKERKVTSSRVKITQLIKAREGKTNVASPAFGYKLSDDRQHLVVNPETAEIYRLIVDKFLEGWGQLKICKYLNSRGIKSKRGSRWNTNSIKTILSNPVYLGVTIYNATIMVRDSTGRQRRAVRPRNEWIIRENTHEPLISKEKFDRIREIIRERKEKDTKEWSCTKKYLLSGILHCGHCGGKLFGYKGAKRKARFKKKSERNDNDYYYYYFDKKLNGKCNSKVSDYLMDVVERKVMDEIKLLLSGADKIEERIRNKRYLYDGRPDRDKPEREDLKDKLDNLMIAIKRQQEAYEAEAINLQEYKSRMQELRDQKLLVQKKLETLNSRLERIDNMEERFIMVRDKVMGFIDNLDNLEFELKEEIIRKLIKRIYIKDDYSIRIEYTFEE